MTMPSKACGSAALSAAALIAGLLVTLAACDDVTTRSARDEGGPATAMASGARKVDPEFAVIVQRSFFEPKDDPQWITIYEIRHANNWQGWATDPPAEHKEALISAGSVSEDKPDDTPDWKKFLADQRARKEEGRAILKNAYELWQKGDTTAAYLGFRDGIGKNNQDNAFAWF
jgi:hypothetical protein